MKDKQVRPPSSYPVSIPLDTKTHEAPVSGNQNQASPVSTPPGYQKKRGCRCGQ